MLRGRELVRIDRDPGGTQALTNLLLESQFDRGVVKAGRGEQALRCCALQGRDSEQDVLGFDAG
jgi:hypothetical protein